MVKIKTQNKELLVVEVPEDVLEDKYFIVFNDKLNSFRVEFQTNKDNVYINLNTDEDCYILGKLSELSEEECKIFVKKMPFSFSDRWLDYSPYLYSANHFKTAKESLISLLQANGVDTSNLNTILLIEKI